jgi:gentisate 1,2-dioxygenase
MRALATSATRVAAGVVNPITGQRFVKNWRIDSLLELLPAGFIGKLGRKSGERLREGGAHPAIVFG